MFCGGDVEKVIYCTGEGSNSCGGTFCGGNLFSRVREDWGSDCVGVLIVRGKEDAEFGLSGLQLRGCCEAGGALFHGGDVLGR